MKHWPETGLYVAVHMSVGSLQASLVHVRPSSQVRPGGMHIPDALQVSSPLHQAPSGQANPAGRLVHAPVLAAVLQYWQVLPGLASLFE
jgi:hypothetical protein